MVRRVIGMRIRGWKAVLAIFVAVGAVVWQILACLESPMSFSPTGDLAFVIMDPYGDGSVDLAGEHVYRLMVLTKDKQLREIERTSSHMLTAPAYSPDGERLAYLRIPLLTPRDKTRIKEFMAERQREYLQAISGLAKEKWIYVAPTESVQGDPQKVMEGWTDLRPEPLQQLGMFGTQPQAGGGVIPGELIIRLASTGDIVQHLRLDIPIFEGLEDSDYYFLYLLTRPQYSPDGGWVYFGALSHVAMAANPATAEKQLLALDAFSSFLSPDGKTLAMLFPKSLGILQTDGARAVYVRLRHEAALSGLAWVGNETLAVLEQGKEGTALDIYNVEGRLLRSHMVPPSMDANEENTGELAVSPDGEYMAISYGSAAHFLTSNGKVLRSWESHTKDELLAQPTFTRDSRQVAFKLLLKEEREGKTWSGTAAIVFFTSEGRELFRVPIPRAVPDQVLERPAQ